MAGRCSSTYLVLVTWSHGTACTEYDCILYGASCTIEVPGECIVVLQSRQHMLRHARAVNADAPRHSDTKPNRVAEIWLWTTGTRWRCGAVAGVSSDSSLVTLPRTFQARLPRWSLTLEPADNDIYPAFEGVRDVALKLENDHRQR